MRHTDIGQSHIQAPYSHAVECAEAGISELLQLHACWRDLVVEYDY